VEDVENKEIYGKGDRILLSVYKMLQEMWYIYMVYANRGDI